MKKEKTEAPIKVSMAGPTANEPLEGPGAGASSANATVAEAAAKRAMQATLIFFISILVELAASGFCFQRPGWRSLS